MQKFLLLALSLCCGLLSAQINYEQGYYLTESGTKVDGFIKNIDWHYNPVSFDFKPSLDAPSQILNISAVQEFRIGSEIIYKRFTLDVDQSSVNIDALSSVKTPEWTKQTIFLKEIASGDLNLYQLNQNSKEILFMGKPGEVPQQLVFKEYRPEGNIIQQNNQFRQQLYVAMNSEIPINEIEKLPYKKERIVKLFRKFNKTIIPEAAKTGSTQYALKVVAGAQQSQPKFLAQDMASPIEFDNKISGAIGLEAEIIFPFNRNKWSLSVSPYYQYYKSTYDKGSMSASLDYKAVVIPVGIRHYMYLNENYRFFINGGLNFIVSLDSELVMKSGFHIFPDNLTMELQNTTSLYGGVGFGNKKISLELRYDANRDPLSSPSTAMKFESIGLFASYRFF